MSKNENMIINRHNYEECFILYWDNELTVSQKQAVENFIKENTDLQEEFKLLGETRFTPDNNIQFEEKGFLLNNSFINVTNYEEQLLNYIDDEIKTDQKKEVEKFVGHYPAVQRELALLQKAKLQPEAEIVFPDKSILYRREEKVRVISMTWFRVAVAAIIILVAGFATFQLVNNNKGIDNSGIVSGNGTKEQSVKSNSDQSTSNPGDQTKNDSDNPAKADDNSTKVESTSTKEKIKKLPIDKNDDSKNLAVNQSENKNNLPKEGKSTDQQSSELIAEADLPPLKRDNHTVQTNQSGAINTGFSDQDVTSNTKLTLYIPEPEQEEKGGLKEFLRKTTRAFERRTKIQTTTDDNKLLVGAFAVSLK